MKLVMNVSSRNENDDGGCVLACVDLTPQLAELALQRIESLHQLQSQDPDADEIYYWNYDAMFFDPFAGPGHDGEPEDPLATGEQLLDRLEKEQKGLIEVDSLFVVPENQLAAIECGQMIVRQLCDRPHNSRNVGFAEMRLESSKSAVSRHNSLFEYNIMRGQSACLRVSDRPVGPE